MVWAVVPAIIIVVKTYNFFACILMSFCSSIVLVFLCIPQVLGEKGMLQVENIHKDPVESSSGNGVTSSTYLHSFPERYKQAYDGELNHFIDVILDPSIPLSVTKEQTLLSSRIAEACEISAKEGRMVEIAAPLKN